MTSVNVPAKAAVHVPLENWVERTLADPVTKRPTSSKDFKLVNGLLDARVFLRNTAGFSDWETGQEAYEAWDSGGEGHAHDISAFKSELEYDRPVYERFVMTGDILDVGGLNGTVREFLPESARLVSVDPFIDAAFRVPPTKKAVYSCLSAPLNFIGGVAEFLPFKAGSFDWVHMRSMLDHVQIPDLAIIEAHRVLKPNGYLLVGLSIEGGKSGRDPFKVRVKNKVKTGLELFGINRYRDHHTWHPTYGNLLRLISDNGFSAEDSYWQPHWKDRVVYVLAKRV